MNKRKRIIIAALLFTAGLARAQTPADKVDPFIGTSDFGTTHPGALCPNGMMAVVPFNVMGSDTNVYDKDARWWSTPYEYRDRILHGFRPRGAERRGMSRDGIAADDGDERAADGGLSGVTARPTATSGPGRAIIRCASTSTVFLPRLRPRRALRPSATRFPPARGTSC